MSASLHCKEYDQFFFFFAVVVFVHVNAVNRNFDSNFGAFLNCCLVLCMNAVSERSWLGGGRAHGCLYSTEEVGCAGIAFCTLAI